MRITALYAGLLGLMLVILSIRVIGARRAARAALGDGGNEMLKRRIRVHGNFTEYVPLALILLAACESVGTSAWQLHALGGMLVAGRTLHAYGVGQVNEVLAVRVTGMSLTFTMIILASLKALTSALL